MIKYLILIFLLVCCKSSKEKKNESFYFVNYSDFEQELSESKTIENFDSKFNLVYIFLLDSSEAKSFYEFDPELESLVKGYRQGIGLNNSTFGFSTSELDLKNVFEDEFSKNMILRCVFGKEFSQLLPKINSPIYIKDNAAIFEISTISSLNVYSWRL